MRFLRKSRRLQPKLSFVLLDWSVRESFHLLHFLANQTADRDSFEVVVVEYYSRISEAIRKFEDQVDTWIVLDMPESTYYHKHLMYNVGIAASCGEIVTIGDSDVLVRPTFIQRIIDRFAADPAMVYHIDEFRNARRDLYPFAYPDFDVVTGPACINYVDGKTAGIRDTRDPVHSRNYGACMSARRSDLIAIGGADEHIDYLGHICGPYDMTFRLFNYGRREIWETEEFMYHTWHPGAGGTGNYLGPHDGRNMSTTAFEALITGRTQPLVQNRAIRYLQGAPSAGLDEVADKLIDPVAAARWSAAVLNGATMDRWVPERRIPICHYRGYRLLGDGVTISGYRPRARRELSSGEGYSTAPDFTDQSLEAAQRRIDKMTPRALARAEWAACCFVFAYRAISLTFTRTKPARSPLRRWATASLTTLVAVPALAIAALFRPRRVLASVSNLIGDSRRAAAELLELALAVHILANGRKAPLESFVLLDQEVYAIAFLRLLAALRIMPGIAIHRVRTTEDIGDRLSSLERRGWSGTVIVSRSAFVRLYSALTDHPLLARMVVV